MSKRISVAAAIIAALILASMNVAADTMLYRWKDSQGNTVMSDRPPPIGTEYESISTESSVVRRVDGAEPPKPMVPQSKPKPAPPHPETNSTVYEKNPEYCENARNNLKVIDRAPRIRMADENGEMRYITDEERASQREANLEIVEKHCE